MIDEFVGDTTADKLKKGLFVSFNWSCQLSGIKGPFLIKKSLYRRYKNEL